MNIPKTFQILTNLNCNLDCTYCYEDKNGRVNNIESIRRFLENQFEKLGDSTSQVNIEIIGGEPFLYPELLEEITELSISLAKKYKRCLLFSISTNATLFGEKRVRDFIEKYGKFYEIGVSIDGVKAVHDKHRRYKGDDKGSYDVIVEHLPWLFEHAKSVGAKATFTNETIFNLSESVIHLAELGFKSIGANPTYESPISLKDGERLALELIKIVDYLFENGLEKTVTPFQLGDFEENKNYLMRLLSSGDEDRNYCGARTHMACLGFDDKVYGCQRFCTMNKSNKTLSNDELYNEVKIQYSKWPQECLSCNLKPMCPSCAAAPYEEDMTPREYFAEKRMCGWTHALAIAKLYYTSLILKKEREDKK